MYIERNMSAYVYNVFTVHNTDIEKQDAFKKQNVCIQPNTFKSDDFALEIEWF